MIKASFKKAFGYFLISSAGALILSSAVSHAQTLTRIQAEHFVEQSGGGSAIVLENNGASVGYFDERGEVLRYSVTVPTSGFYTISYRYLAGSDGEFVVRTAAGAEGFAAFSASVSQSTANWWEIPFQEWATKTSSTQFYLQAGTQSLFLLNRGVGLNLDYLDLTFSPNQSLVVDRIESTPARLEVKPNHSAEITARAFAGAVPVAAPLSWSANVKDGVYSAGAAGSDTINIAYGAISKSVPVTIQMPRAKYRFVVSEHGALKVQTNGNQGFLDKNNRLASFAGPSWFWSDSTPEYWTKEMVSYFVQDWKAGMIRLPMSIAPGRYCDAPSSDPTSTCFNIGSGQLSKDPKTGERGVTWNKNNYFHNPEASLNQMKAMIDAAIENDVYVVVDFHEHHAELLIPQAQAFFEEIAKLYGHYPNVMFEIFNEPLPRHDWNIIANYAKQVIPVIRKYSSNPIIVGTQSWSQRTDAVDNQLTGFGNIAYTLHYYAAMHGSSLVSKLDVSKPLMITESGNDGPAMWDYINKAREKGISWASWSVASKGGFDEAWSIFVANNNFKGPWTDADLREAGKTQRGIIRGWPRVVAAPTPICDDEVVSRLVLSANGETNEQGAPITVDVNTSTQITLKAFSSCKEVTVAPNAVQWSANAPAGLYLARALGDDAVSASFANKTASVAIKVVPERPFAKKIEVENCVSTSTGVQTEATTDVGGGLNVGWIDAGDAINCPLDLPKAGLYKVSYRVASQANTGIFELIVNQSSKDTVQFAPTGGWQTWATVEKLVNLPAGSVGLTVKAATGGWNINWVQVESAQAPASSSSSSIMVPSSTSSSSSIVSSSSIASSSSIVSSSSIAPSSSRSSSSVRSSSSISSSSSSSIVIPAQITVQAEAYDVMSGVQTEATSDVGGGLNVGWIDANDWMAYGDVNLPCTGEYTLELRVASPNGGKLQLEQRGGSPVLGAYDIPATGGYQAWRTLAFKLDLREGTMRFGIKALQGGWNLNWYRLIPQCGGGNSSSSVPSSSSSSSSSISSTPSSSSSSSVQSGFACNAGNSTNTGGNPTGASQGSCLAYTMSPWGNLQLGSWNAPAGVRYDIRNCNGVILRDVAQIQNAFVGVQTGTNGCTHYIHVKQAANPFTLQFGSW